MVRTIVISAASIISLLLSTVPVQSQTLHAKPCPILNLAYPIPSSFASSTIIQSAIRILHKNITEALNASTVYGQLDTQANAFSIDVYSLSDEAPLFNYHYPPSELMAQPTEGVTTVDSNTIYRIGSISKMMTVYIYLIAKGDTTWEDPVTRYIPELAAYMERHQNLSRDNPIDFVDWSSITIGALATHLSGIAREEVYSPAFETTLQQSLGLPPSFRNESAMCGDDTIKIPCDRTAFFDDFLKQHPFTAPFKTPIYSNVAFQILGYVMENITGTFMSDLFNQTLVQPLGLNSTHYSIPPTTNSSIIPINATASLWNFDARGETPTGGYYSSINDLREVGRSILNFTLLTPAQTRRWLKPFSFTANTKFAVGAPWEILRAPSAAGEPVTWIYSKTSAFGTYGGILALMPDYNVGFTVLSAGFSTTNTARIISEIIVENIVPAVYNASEDAALLAYGGKYSFANSTTNSSITISTPLPGPGLYISDWTLNGKQASSILGSLLGVNETTQTLNITLYPSGLTSNNGSEVSWRAFLRVLPQILDPGIFSENCVSWASANTVTYTGVGLDEFLFKLDNNGNAISVEPRLLGLELLRADGYNLPQTLFRD